MKKNQIILYVVVGILLLGILLMTFFPNMIYLVKDSTSQGGDKCIAPEGQTQEQWDEHISHHLSMYKECFT